MRHLGPGLSRAKAEGGVSSVVPVYRRAYVLQPIGFTWVLIDPGRTCTVHVVNASVGEAYDIDLYAGQAGLQKAELFCGLLGNIDDSTADAGTSIVDLEQRGFMVPEVGNANFCAKGEFWVRSGKFIFIKQFPARSVHSLAFHSVPACHSNFALG